MGQLKNVGKGLAWAAGGIAGAAALGCFLVAPRRGAAGWERFAGYRFAHRGLFDQPLSASMPPFGSYDGRGAACWMPDIEGFGRPVVPENSLPAFRRAVEHGFGAELDVHLTRDKRLAVVHDSDLMRVCGQAGIVEEMSSTELGALRLLGTDERIPYLEEVLPLFETGGCLRATAPEGDDAPSARAPKMPAAAMPLIVEFKVYGENYDELATTVVRCLDRFDLPWCIESFDPRALIWLRRNRPDVIRGQLACDFLKEPASESVGVPARIALTNLLTDVCARPDFVAYRYEERTNPMNRLCCGVLGAHPVSWTLHSEEQIRTAEGEGGIVIFERFVPEA